MVRQHTGKLVKTSSQKYRFITCAADTLSGSWQMKIILVLVCLGLAVLALALSHLNTARNLHADSIRVKRHSHHDGVRNQPRFDKKYITSECDVTMGCKDPKFECIHISNLVQLEDGSVLPANTLKQKGYCLMNETPRAAVACNPRYGAPITTITPSGLLRVTCRCFWPSLFDQKDIYSDCSIVRACNGTGALVHSKTRTPLDKMPLDEKIDIHEFECRTCGASNCALPGKDPDMGLPNCTPTPLGDRTDGLCLYENLVQGGTDLINNTIPAESGRHTSAPVLAIKGVFISEAFAKHFPNSSLPTAYVPNPCAYDAFRGVSIQNECRLTLTPSGTGYCEPLSETVSTIVFDDDYLPNNGGRYSNACYKFTNSNENIDAYIVEYFVRPNIDIDDGNSSGIRPPPLPTISLEINTNKVDPNILSMLNASADTTPQGKILITHAAIPDDVDSIPLPFDKSTMSRFVKERNDFVHYVPSQFAFAKFWAPVQTLDILDCDNINDERRIKGFSLKTIEDGEYAIKRQQHVVACREPHYDKRLAIVPNIDVNHLGAEYNADPTSAILRFDKSDLVVRPYWYRSYFNNKLEVKAYVSRLPSRPPPLARKEA